MQIIAYLSLILWATALISFAPSAWRYMRRFDLIDSYRTALFFASALWTVGLGRLIWLPQAEDVRAGVLALSCILALYLLVLARQGSIK